MKLIGAIILTSSTSVIGILLSKNLKDKVSVCDDLISFCELLSLELSYTVTPIKEIISMSNVDFVTEDYLVSPKLAPTVLSDVENKKISEFLYSLGKSDIKTQLSLVEGFKVYAQELKTKYKSQYESKSKVYISLGASLGMIISLVLL